LITVFQYLSIFVIKMFDLLLVFVIQLMVLPNYVTPPYVTISIHVTHTVRHFILTDFISPRTFPPFVSPTTFSHSHTTQAAVGILEYAQQYHAIELKESWYEKLQRWEDALEAYERRQLEDPTSIPGSARFFLLNLKC
jgi:hypothetical protein